MRGLIVLRYTIPRSIHETKVVLRIGISLICSQLIPTYGLGIVLHNAKAIAVHETKVGLRIHISLICSQLMPTYGLGIVLHNAKAFFVHDTKVVLRIGISFFCQGHPFVKCGDVITIIESGPPRIEILS